MRRRSLAFFEASVAVRQSLTAVVSGKAAYEYL